MNPVRSGQLNRRITLQRQSIAQDSYGAPILAWTDLGTFWAEIEPLSGRELESAQRMASEVSHQIVMRYQAIFADTRRVASYRALYRARIFNIHAALNDEESNVSVTLLASEGLSDG